MMDFPRIQLLIRPFPGAHQLDDNTISDFHSLLFRNRPFCRLGLGTAMSQRLI